MADAAVTGLLQGKTITLDAPVPPLDGQRVHVIISPANETAELSREEEARLWEEALTLGPIASRDLAAQKAARKAELDLLVEEWAALSEEESRESPVGKP